MGECVSGEEVKGGGSCCPGEIMHVQNNISSLSPLLSSFFSFFFPLPSPFLPSPTLLSPSPPSLLPLFFHTSSLASFSHSLLPSPVGVPICNNLQLGKHCRVVKSANKLIGYNGRTFELNAENVTLTPFNAFVRPRFESCV